MQKYTGKYNKYIIPTKNIWCIISIWNFLKCIVVPQQSLPTMFKLFCLTKGKSLVVKCKINSYTNILIRVLFVVWMKILETSQFVDKMILSISWTYFKVWLLFIFLLKGKISHWTEIFFSNNILTSIFSKANHWHT